VIAINEFPYALYDDSKERIELQNLRTGLLS
jgi:hypothetical protein